MREDPKTASATAATSSGPSGANTSDGTASAHKEPLIERPGTRLPRLREIRRDLGLQYCLNAVVGLIFGITGPIAVTMAVGLAGGLSDAQLSSWVFGIFLSAGLATLVMSLVYRRPLGFAWSIPGTVLLGPSLQHLSFGEVVGAFFVAGVLTLGLGMSGLVRRAMAAIPPPIVMAMVAALFLRFGIDIVDAGRSTPAIVIPMIVTFIALTALPGAARFMPPVLGALLVGFIAVVALDQLDLTSGGPVLASPVFTPPEFTWAAQLELVVPLTLTVLVVQNGQGEAVLRSAGHATPVNASAVTSGIMSVLNACFGAVSACLTGPTNALLTSSGDPNRQYSAAVFYSFLCFIAALFSPLVTRFMLGTPEAYILALGGMAMLGALRQAFVSAFSSKYTFGALVTFVVTIAEFDLFNIHAAFWGILIGCIASRFLEPGDYSADRFSA
ncbi:benzoate/H(+) symporter BenE family transporter [Brevibacterium marinum]|uniref:Benzoate membrane transport protein n=1 Tax=Brevibacterium marinum TaxID=418643 RepID=A0A846S0R2_9MICO|nr:benzoate/H(+) symporter BenE family transporter [Brevibacterium marinum]NJC55192.1 benzoate membrane transport protein [Brevibacterium marinum]